jgi:hypothetical protein
VNGIKDLSGMGQQSPFPDGGASLGGWYRVIFFYSLTVCYVSCSGRNYHGVVVVKTYAYCASGIFAMIVIISLVMTGIAAGSSYQDTTILPVSDGNSAGIGTESTHTIGTIHYIRVTSTGVYRTPLDPSNLIYIAAGEALFLQVPAKVSGPSNQKGVLLIGLPTSGTVTHSLVLTPGKQKTLTTNLLDLCRDLSA